MSTPTPRTQAKQLPADDFMPHLLVVPADLSRQLEREVIALTAEDAKLREALERARTAFENISDSSMSGDSNVQRATAGITMCNAALTAPPEATPR